MNDKPDTGNLINKQPLTMDERVAKLKLDEIYIYATFNTNIFMVGHYKGLSPDGKAVRIYRCTMMVVPNPDQKGHTTLNWAKMPGEFLGKMQCDTHMELTQIAYTVDPNKDIIMNYLQVWSSLVHASSMPTQPPVPQPARR